MDKIACQHRFLPTHKPSLREKVAICRWKCVCSERGENTKKCYCDVHNSKQNTLYSSPTRKLGRHTRKQWFMGKKWEKGWQKQKLSKGIGAFSPSLVVPPVITRPWLHRSKVQISHRTTADMLAHSQWQL